MALDLTNADLLSEYHALYLQVAQARKKLAPLGDIHWRVPNSGFEKVERISPNEYKQRLAEIYNSGDHRKIRAGLEEMQRILQAVEGR